MPTPDISALALKETCLLTVEEMSEADRLTIADGIPGLDLMETAGAACVDVITTDWQGPRETVVLCGPGNNGGDGFVIARLLEQEGWPVRVALFGSADKLRDDAAAMAERWIGDAQGELELFKPECLDGAELIVDAIFGAGLARDVSGKVADLVAAVNAHPAPVAAVDIPTGIDGNTGAVRGCAIEATVTITFFRKKRGHILFPGRAHCGPVLVADIGIADEVLDEITPQAVENDPLNWLASFPWPGATDHKYTRGHVVAVSGGMTTTGAGRLAARGAIRAGAGLVSVASPKNAVMVNAAHLTSIMLKPFSDSEDLRKLLEDPRLNAVVIGPGAGLGERTKENVKVVLDGNRAVVLDADALTSFENKPSELFDITKQNTVVTPHEGEFRRLFPKADFSALSRIEVLSQEMTTSSCVIVLKGPDTIISSPDGRLAINSNAPPQLATAGSGDVLAGIICGLMAQGMEPFEAACAGVWVHSEAAHLAGLGMISEDIPEYVPGALEALRDLLIDQVIDEDDE